MRFLFLICFLFVALLGQAQFPITQNQGSPTTLIKSRGGQQIDSGLVIGVFADTTAANAGFIDAIPGIMIRTVSPLNTFYFRNSTATQWLPIASSSGLDSLITNGIIEIDFPENQLLRYGGDNWRNTYRTDSSILPKAVTDSLYLTNIYYVVGSGVDTIKQEKNGILTIVGILSQSNQGGSSGTYIVDGCAVVWTGVGLTFYITDCSCYINGVLYTAPDTTVTLDPADATHGRIDAFMMDTTSMSYNVTGMASDNPITPQADPTYQIFLTDVQINANDTALSAARAVIYNNNSVGEWTNSSPIAYPIDFFSTAETFIPPYAADWLSGGPQRLAYFTLGADSINVSGYQSISAFVKLKAALTSPNSSVAVQMYNNGQAVSTVTRFPLVRTNTDWQAIQLPLSSFSYLTPNRWVDSLVVSYRNFNGGAAITGAYFDYFTFNSGVNPPNPNGNFVDSFYFASEVLNDSMFVLKRSDGRRDTLTILGRSVDNLPYIDSVYRVAGEDSINIKNSAGYTYKIKDSTGIWTMAGDTAKLIPSVVTVIDDTTTYKPAVLRADGHFGRLDRWPVPDISGKLNISDTAGMLSPYLRSVGIGLLKSGQTVLADTGRHTIQLITGGGLTKVADSLGTLIGLREPAIAAGVASQFYSWDKTWRSLNTGYLTDFPSQSGNAGKFLQTDGSVLSWAAGGGGGVTTLAAIGASPNVNGATISGSALNLQPASASFGGVVTTGTQTFSGNKTINDTLYVSKQLINRTATTGSSGDGLNIHNWLDRGSAQRIGVGLIQASGNDLQIYTPSNGSFWFTQAGGSQTTVSSYILKLSTTSIFNGSLQINSLASYTMNPNLSQASAWLRNAGATYSVGGGFVNGSGQDYAYFTPTAGKWYWYGGGSYPTVPSATEWMKLTSSGLSLYSPSNSASAQFELGLTNRGILGPRLTTAQRNAVASPAANLQVSNTELDLDNDYNGTTWTVNDGTIFTQTADKNVNTTVTETTLFGTGSGTLTIPANYLYAGNTVVIKIQGYMTTNGTPTLNIRFKLGSTTIASTGAVTLVSVGSNGYWEAECTLTPRASPSGASAIMGQGYFTYHDTQTTANHVSAMNTATVNAATNGSLAVDITATWGTSDAANKIVSTNAWVEIKN